MRPNHVGTDALTVWLARAMSSIAAITLLGLLSLGQARAHEVQDSVADLSSADGRLTLSIEMTVEAPLAGLNLEGLSDTNESANAELYDELRAFEPEVLSDALSDFWPEFREKFTIRAGDTPLELSLDGVDIPEVGDVEVQRLSTLRLSAPLPNDAPVVIGWEPALGTLIVRQMGVEDGYTGYLTSGALSEPIDLAGGSALSAWESFTTYIVIGFEHIIPKGLDHILFVLGLFFLALQVRPLLWQVTAFTLAHTVTLALGILGIITIPASIVEPLIALSIVYVGVENVLSRGLTPWRPFVVFGFGLLHGLGFASVLGDIGLDPTTFVVGLVGFNIGVEIGQLAVIAAAYLTLGWLFAGNNWYKTRLANPVSVGIAVVALFWVFERTGVIGTEGLWAPLALITEGGLGSLWGWGALAIMAAITGAVLAIGTDGVRDAGGFATSFVAFLGVTAMFTSSAWVVMIALVAGWIVAIRAQALGGSDNAPRSATA